MTAQLVERAEISLPSHWSELQRLFQVAVRYGLSAAGPIAMSAAHFIAAFLLLHALSQSEFGLFSFVLIIVPFCLSMSGALLGPSVSVAIIRAQGLAEAELATHLKANLAFSALAAACIAGLMIVSGAGITLALLFGLYGGLMTLRTFSRAYAYAMGRRLQVTLSDFTYSGLLLAGLCGLLVAGQLNVLNTAIAFTAAVAIALAPFGASYLRDQFRPAASGSLMAYKSIWREFARWSLLGVVLTEITANAHAYLVTFICGPKSFALLAAGALFMRPVSLCFSALPDLERPLMARSIAGGNFRRAFRSVKEFRMAAGGAWLATLVLAAILLTWFPQLVLKSGYDRSDVLIVVGLWALIMAVRAIRTPESVLLQAAREFRPLAGSAIWSSMVSLTVTLVLLFFAGPIASLCGILVGDVVMTAGILSLSHAWRRRHG